MQTLILLIDNNDDFRRRRVSFSLLATFSMNHTLTLALALSTSSIGAGFRFCHILTISYPFNSFISVSCSRFLVLFHFRYLFCFSRSHTHRCHIYTEETHTDPERIAFGEYLKDCCFQDIRPNGTPIKIQHYKWIGSRFDNFFFSLSRSLTHSFRSTTEINLFSRCKLTRNAAPYFFFSLSSSSPSSPASSRFHHDREHIDD